jgi:methionyl-tRNA formyltransferase
VRYRTVYFGTPEFAVPTLSALHEMSDVVGVVSQPDRPQGRGLQLGSPAVVGRARELGLALYQPSRVRDGALERWLREREPEIAVVAAYGRILPPGVLAAPRRGCINLHASLLPAHRGSAPIQWALLRGERETGISLMQMDEGMDTGPVFVKRALPIGPETNAGELTEALAALAADVLREHLLDVIEGRLTAEPQDASRASHAPPITAEQQLIDWNEPASRVHDQVRAFAPKPGAHTLAGGKRLKILESRVDERSGAAAELFAFDGGRLLVGCGSGSLAIVRAQLEGRKAQDARELVNGRALKVGQRLG